MTVQNAQVDHPAGITYPWPGLAVGQSYRFTRPTWGQAHLVTIEQGDPGPRVRFDPTEPLPTLLAHVPADAVFLPAER